MKPIAEKIERRKRLGFTSDSSEARLPLVDCNYQVYSLDRYHGGSTGGPPNSFLNISRDYFQREARRNFLAETTFFLAMVVVLAGAFIEGARVIIHFLHLPTA